jgi:hypothetical protein
MNTSGTTQVEPPRGYTPMWNLASERDLVAYPSEERFADALTELKPFIETSYAIPVLVGHVPKPFTCDLDGAQIIVDCEQSPEDSLFIVAHLFGHTVQWNTDVHALAIGTATIVTPSAKLLRNLIRYEQTACRYSLRVLHDANIRDLDQWLSDYAACDCAYLMHFYQTGEKREFRSFWRRGTPTLRPMPIPSFSPTLRVSRASGVVI